MPREGTKTIAHVAVGYYVTIEIRYAPGGDENSPCESASNKTIQIEIRYAPGGDENLLLPAQCIELI